ncbi:hypothetical protein LDL08_01960 [Nonomuraea glycinis]|uniref:LPXTG cell wall anchor domain-containing protein n=1 Tax=Nonomuraea glycinis TaxID=2047744 RepID=A0A917ZYR8_9ACTN|nr:hypothetical protein [Nonomuraea glycinis]MCA2174942.1 hypothetical protein [Nonomuraea glycinis]GGP01317.1 hypothetical protein GCM10012278_04210 [Nonomuraea glycinis]
MSARFGMRSITMLAGVAVTGVLTFGAGPAAHADVDDNQKVLLQGSTTASYFWDDSSGRAGDTGLPASGKPMQKGMAASPSWPLMTEGYVVYKGKKMPFFVGDRGPGAPSNTGIMLDLDSKTFAELTGGRFNPRTLMVDSNGGKGHIKVQYVITKWGKGVGKKNHPVAFSTGAWSRKDANPAKPPQILAEKKVEEKAVESKPIAEAPSGSAFGGPAFVRTEPVSGPAGPSAAAAPAEEPNGVAGAVLAGGLALVGGGAILGRDRIRRFMTR